MYHGKQINPPSSKGKTGRHAQCIFDFGQHNRSEEKKHEKRLARCAHVHVTHTAQQLVHQGLINAANIHLSGKCTNHKQLKPL
jgi:hypothetical protein